MVSELQDMSVRDLVSATFGWKMGGVFLPNPLTPLLTQSFSLQRPPPPTV